ncbi:MAG: AhpC/TSA family protein [Chitinophagaceae bacterium]|nr:AhpC/TSA family protein [Chitinophagaceae bacterium]
MIKMKWPGLLLLLLAVNVHVFAFKKKHRTVKGKITNAEGVKGVLVVKRTGEFTIDTVATGRMNEKGEFSIDLPSSSYNEFLELRLEGGRSGAQFVAENGTVWLEANKKTMHLATVKGTPENKRWNDYQLYQRQMNVKMNQLRAGGNFNDEAKAQYNELGMQVKKYTDSLAKNCPGSIVALFLSKIPLPMMKHTQIDSVLSNFKPYFSNHPYYLEMKERADILRKVAPGAVAPGFNAKQADGKTPISLADLRGKYVLLDFWASWCMPCREENKHTKVLYEQYHAKGLEVLSFSLDSDLGAWQKAIEKDELPWKHASDLVGGKLSPVAKEYGIDGIPAIWIINPDGVIIAEGLRGEKLEKFIASLFNK